MIKKQGWGKEDIETWHVKGKKQGGKGVEGIVERETLAYGGDTIMGSLLAALGSARGNCLLQKEPQPSFPSYSVGLLSQISKLCCNLAYTETI